MDRRKPFLLPHPGIAREFDILFTDTEFSRLPLPTESMFAWAKHSELLSLGITSLEASVTPSGLYAVRLLDKTLRSRCTSFVIDEVLPHLEAVSPTVRFRSPAQLRKPLATFLSDRRRATGKPAAIAVDWAGDAFLLGEALPPDTDVLLLEGMLSIARAMETFFIERHYRRHNAFHDALALRSGFMDYLAADR